MDMSRSILFSSGGCVLNKPMSVPPLRGFTMNMCAVEGFASMGTRREASESFLSPDARPAGDLKAWRHLHRPRIP